MAYTIIRTDNMHGTKDPTKLKSVIVVDGEGKGVEVENGTLVKIAKKLKAGEREVHEATVMVGGTTFDASKFDLGIVAGVEIMYDERKAALDEFINEAGRVTRAYILDEGDEFAVTTEGIDGTAPAVDALVYCAATKGKLTATNVSNGRIGVVEHIETKGKKTFYTVNVTLDSGMKTY